ncbi:hypothetical protein KUTeg_005800, partial [Tegillarca granosa]
MTPIPLLGKRKVGNISNINVEDDLNVAHFENVETSDHIVVASDKYINIIETVQNLEKELVNESNIISELSTCTQEIVAEVNDRTVGQHQNPMWLSARSGRITAFNFHDVKTKKDSTKSDCLVSKFLCKSSGSVDKSALIWGRKQEPIAKKLGQQNQTLTNPFQPHRLTTQVCICKRRTKRLKPVYVPISFSKPQTKVEIFSCPFCRTSTIPSSLVRRSALHTDSFKASEPLNGMMPYGLAKTYSLLMLLIFIHSGMIDTTPEKTTPMQHKLLPYNTYIY